MGSCQTPAVEGHDLHRDTLPLGFAALSARSIDCCVPAKRSNLAFVCALERKDFLPRPPLSVEVISSFPSPPTTLVWDLKKYRVEEDSPDCVEEEEFSSRMQSLLGGGGASKRGGSKDLSCLATGEVKETILSDKFFRASVQSLPSKDRLLIKTVIGGRGTRSNTRGPRSPTGLGQL
jgi:hypothetical protein